ncbi:MAG TPA: cupin domain-containing protein [Vicinamibacterales bacterium]|nr:cupin domain-containing protein [Vicinamibacterales bacterium]
MKRIFVAAGLVAVAFASALAQQPGTTPQFTGKSTPMDGKDLSAARRSFEAGARSYWHSHDNGQLLFVEKGHMRTAKRGQQMKELGPGESDYTGPNVVHWHGAAPNEELIQINIGFGGGSKWYEAVSDADYNGKK